MKQRFSLILLFSLFSLCAVFAGSSDHGLSLLSEQTVSGSSRYVGMGGAMGAVGGDVSAAVDNPAGIGLFRRSELSVSMDISGQRCSSEEEMRSILVSAPSVSWLFHFGSYGRVRGVLGQSLAFSYGRRCGIDERWLGHVQPDYARQWLYWRGTAEVRQDDYNLDYGINIDNQLYFGVGMSLRTYRMVVLADYSGDEATIAKSSNDVPSDQLVSYDDERLSTLGVGLRAGVLYRPTNWLRLGGAIHTPTWVSKMQRMPMRTVAALAFQLQNIAIISAEYDFNHDGTGNLKDEHLLKSGVEYVFLKNGFLNAGYAYSFNTSRHIATVGLSWRSKHFVAGMAYMFGRTGMPQVRSSFNIVDTPLLKYSHNFVFTLAFRYGG